MLCTACESKVKTLRLLDEALDDLDEAEATHGLDLSDERAELERLRAAVEQSQAA
jgi:hypothetical protein